MQKCHRGSRQLNQSHAYPLHGFFVLPAGQAHPRPAGFFLGHIMKVISIVLSMAASLIATGIANAQQHQLYGRDSMYVVPDQRSTPPAPSGPGLVSHFGRDSVYVTQMPGPPSTAPALGQSLQQFGRDSVYAKGSPDAPTAPGSETNVGTTDHAHDHGG